MSSSLKFSIENILGLNLKCSSDDRSSSVESSENELSTNIDTVAPFSWLHCSRIRPPKLPRVRREKKSKYGRSPRVPFTKQQVNLLERRFQQTHYLSGIDVAEISTSLNLTETRVKIWFQNRRARERREKSLAGNVETTSFQPIGMSDSLCSMPSPVASSIIPGSMPRFSAPFLPLWPTCSAATICPDILHNMYGTLGVAIPSLKNTSESSKSSVDVKSNQKIIE